jgi:hypothetical protein
MDDDAKAELGLGSKSYEQELAQLPQNWTKSRKWINVYLVSTQATLSPVCSTLLAVGALEISEELHVTNTDILALPVALFILGLGLGPLR